MQSLKHFTAMWANYPDDGRTATMLRERLAPSRSSIELAVSSMRRGSPTHALCD
jgi:hypothetical protein